MPPAMPATPRAAIQRLGWDHVVEWHGLPQAWGRRAFWQIRLRWGVAPLMILGVLASRALGFELVAAPIILIALASVVYNLAFAWIFTRLESRLEKDAQLDLFFTVLQVLVDYLAMFLLLFYTGGVSSPLVFFLIFHIILAAIQFSAGTAYGFAGFATIGLWLLWLGQVTDVLPSHGITFRGQTIHLLEQPVHAAVLLLFFTATLFLTATMTSQIMLRLRERVRDLAEATAGLASINDKLHSLYAMVFAIAGERHLQPILDTVTSELARATEVKAVAIKFLEENGKTLRFEAAYGLPKALVAETVIHLERSELNRRIIEGETLVHGSLNGDSSLQLHKELSALGIRSAVLAPLRVEGEIIGTLGLYCDIPDRFDGNDTDFLKLAAQLVGIAIEDARANEAVESLMQERTQFMLRVAHNLRAPLGASLGMLEILGDNYLGKVNPQQSDYIRKIDTRLRALDATIGELLSIAQARDWSREIPDVVVNLEELARHTERTFHDEAYQKGLRLVVESGKDLPEIDSGVNLLEQLMENLVSNAIKYTPEGGEITVHMGQDKKDEVRITVTDTGIGIPTSEQNRLFEEFFRASNAKKLTAAGTGLGLALVKKTVERHNGKMRISSEEGQGTTVVIELPAREQGPIAP